LFIKFTYNVHVYMINAELFGNPFFSWDYSILEVYFKFIAYHIFGNRLSTSLQSVIFSLNIIFIFIFKSFPFNFTIIFKSFPFYFQVAYNLDFTRLSGEWPERIQTHIFSHFYHRKENGRRCFSTIEKSFETFLTGQRESV
jgi:hypothetical protein